jgi:exopolyphosphatase/guanosine-5'-triphosphate,3'-diphosphate pyrophosphatase
MKDEARGADPERSQDLLGRHGGAPRSIYGRRPVRKRRDFAGNRRTYAALDLGTNNCRLLVARPTPDGFRVVDAFSRIIRLGEGVSVSGVIGDAAISRAIDALTICRDKMHDRGVSRARLIATEACRAAANGGEFVRHIREKVGIELEIVDRETEAKLAATGCSPLIEPDASSIILFDIGGGSSELVLLGPPRRFEGGPPAPEIRAWASLPLGVVTLAERYGGMRVDRPVFEQMIADAAHFVQRFADDKGKDVPGLHMIGTSGTVTTIAGVHLGLKRYDRRQVDGCWLTQDEITAVIEDLLAMSYEERVANGCIGAERADLVLAGCAILEAIRQVFPCTRLRVADRGLREGILVELMREDGIWNKRTGF